MKHYIRHLTARAKAEIKKDREKRDKFVNAFVRMATALELLAHGVLQHFQEQKKSRDRIHKAKARQDSKLMKFYDAALPLAMKMLQQTVRPARRLVLPYMPKGKRRQFIPTPFDGPIPAPLPSVGSSTPFPPNPPRTVGKRRKV